MRHGMLCVAVCVAVSIVICVTKPVEENAERVETKKSGDSIESPL